MKKSTWAWILVIVVILGIWYLMSSKKEEPAVSTSTSSTESSSSTKADSAEKPSVPLVNLANSETLGKYIVASNAMTLYTYSKDTTGVSNCTGTCATTWPPYIPSSLTPMQTGYGVTGTLATLTRADGSKQLTFNGMPLYYYKSDVKAGDTKGQGVGGVWYVVTIKP